MTAEQPAQLDRARARPRLTVAVLSLTAGLAVAVLVAVLPRSKGNEGVVLRASTDSVNRYMGAIHALDGFDVDGDGVPEAIIVVDDSAVGSPDRIEAWSRDGHRVASRVIDGPKYTGFIVSEWCESAGDVDGDGLGEILIDGFSSPALVTLASGARREACAGPILDGAAGADFDGDGRADLVFASRNGTRILVEARRGSGAVLWTRSDEGAPPSSKPEARGAAVAIVGDVDRDGIGDVAWISYSLAPEVVGEVRLLSGANGSTLANARGPSWCNVESAGDLDGDGIGDAVVDAGAQALVLSGQDLVELGRFPFAFEFSHRAKPLGDLDWDGDSELLVASSDGVSRPARATIYSGGAAVALCRIEFGSDITDPTFGIASAGDLDGDGVMDVTVCEPRTEEYELLPAIFRYSKRSTVAVWSGESLVARPPRLLVR